MLKKQYRLTKKRDFDLVYKKGKRFRGKYGMLIALPWREISATSATKSPESVTTPKFGFIVGRKLGNAVARHKFQRRLRHVVAGFLSQYPDAFKTTRFSYVAYESPTDFSVLKADLQSLLKLAMQRV